MNYGKIMTLVLLGLHGACAVSLAKASDAVTPQESAAVSSVIQIPFTTEDSINIEPNHQKVQNSSNKELQVNLANSSNATEELPLQKGMPYKEARQLLIQQGWQPNLQGDPPNLRDRSVSELFDLGYEEIEDCSGTGEGPCRFKFINEKGDLLFVVATTNGAENTKRFVRNWWIEKKTDTTQKSVPLNQIAEGRYWLGATDQGLEVRGNQYRYDTEAGTQQWKPISELQYIKNGVVFDGKTYWCLSTFAPRNRVPVCSANGWVAQEILPFVGTRRFNFLGGSGTGQSITIKADGSTVVELHGTMSSSVLYRGQFSNPIILEDGRGLLLRGNKVHQVSADGQIVKSCNGKETCEAELY